MGIIDADRAGAVGVVEGAERVAYSGAFALYEIKKHKDISIPVYVFQAKAHD